MKKIYYRKISCGIYQLYQDFTVQTRLRIFATVSNGYIELTKDGLLTLKRGYVSDGPSGPTFDTKSSIRGAFVHGALYRLMRLGLVDISWRKASDEEIRDLCIEDKMYRWRAKAWYRSLRVLGYPNAKYDPLSCLVSSAP